MSGLSRRDGKVEQVLGEETRSPLWTWTSGYASGDRDGWVDINNACGQ